MSVSGAPTTCVGAVGAFGLLLLLLAVAFLRHTANADCVATSPLNRGVCTALKTCMCGNEAAFRVKLLNMPHVHRCDGRAKVRDFREPPRFRYQHAKSSKQYLVIFAEYKSNENRSLFIHWFEGDASGAALKMGIISGFRTIAYRPIQVLSNANELRRYQLMLFEQPRDNMMKTLSTNEDHTAYRADPSKRKWSSLEFILRKYHMCDSLVAGFQFRVSTDGVDSNVLSMCEPTRFMESSVELGVTAGQAGVDTKICLCKLDRLASSLPVTITFTAMQCPRSAPQCQWSTAMYQSYYTNGCFSAAKWSLCCDHFHSAPRVIGQQTDRESIIIWVEKNSSAKFKGKFSARIEYENAAEGLLDVQCGLDAQSYTQHKPRRCVSTTRRSVYAVTSDEYNKTKTFTTTTTTTFTTATMRNSSTKHSSKPKETTNLTNSNGSMLEVTGNNDYVLSGVTILLVCTILALIALVSELLGVYLWDQKRSKKVPAAPQTVGKKGKARNYKMKRKKGNVK